MDAAYAARSPLPRPQGHGRWRRLAEACQHAAVLDAFALLRASIAHWSRPRGVADPPPLGQLMCARSMAVCACACCGPEPLANRRVKDARRSVTGPLSAASARYLRICDSDFGAVKGDFSKYGDIEPLPNR